MLYYQGAKKVIETRSIVKKRAELSGLHPVLERIFLARGLDSPDDLDRALAKLPSPWLLSGMESMIDQLVDALEKRKRITIIADFDADGATSCAVAIKGLQLLGAGEVAFVVPNRFEYGYGLTPEIVELVKRQNPDVLLTVDNGIASIDGVKAAKESGMTVLVTDHHLPGSELPPADAIVNPNMPDDRFPSGALAGVGVIFYVLMALRIRLRKQNWFAESRLQEPNLAQLLDYVALGTVADVVELDYINRILVHQGLLRIRQGRGHPGLNALIEVSGRKAENLQTADLGFALGPRINAAGRLDDMSLGIQCLLADDPIRAKELALQLDDLNNGRKEIEGQMKQEALSLLSGMRLLDENHLAAGVCLYDANWHQGVIGILASRIKDRLHRPVVAFAPAGKDLIKGSARSIPGVHIRDVLSDIAAAYPKVLQKFGGHAMAAGLSLHMHDYPPFVLAFDEMVRKRLQAVDLEQKILSDGELSEPDMSVEFAELLRQAATWGQGFPEPVFHGTFDVVKASIVAQRHLKLVLRIPSGNLLVDAIAFSIDHPERWLGLRSCLAAYRLDINEFRGQRSVQFIVQYLEKIA